MTPPSLEGIDCVCATWFLRAAEQEVWNRTVAHTSNTKWTRNAINTHLGVKNCENIDSVNFLQENSREPVHFYCKFSSP